MASIESQNLNIHAEERLETPKEVAARVGITVRQVRYLIQTRQLEYVLIGCRPHVPVGAFSRFLERKKVPPCQDETRDRALRWLAKRHSFYITWTEYGRSRERSTGTANRSSRSFSSSATAEARVIPMKSS